MNVTSISRYYPTLVNGIAPLAARITPYLTVVNIALGVFSILGACFVYYRLNQKPKILRGPEDYHPFETVFTQNTLSQFMLDSKVLNLTHLLTISEVTPVLRRSFFKHQNFRFQLFRRLVIYKAIKLARKDNGVFDLVLNCRGTANAIQVGLKVLKSTKIRTQQKVVYPAAYFPLVGDLARAQLSLRGEEEAKKILERYNYPAVEGVNKNYAIRDKRKSQDAIITSRIYDFVGSKILEGSDFQDALSQAEKIGDPFTKLLCRAEIVMRRLQVGNNESLSDVNAFIDSSNPQELQSKPFANIRDKQLCLRMHNRSSWLNRLDSVDHIPRRERSRWIEEASSLGCLESLAVHYIHRGQWRLARQIYFKHDHNAYVKLVLGACASKARGGIQQALIWQDKYLHELIEAHPNYMGNNCEIAEHQIKRNDKHSLIKGIRIASSIQGSKKRQRAFITLATLWAEKCDLHFLIKNLGVLNGLQYESENWDEVARCTTTIIRRIFNGTVANPIETALRSIRFKLPNFDFWGGNTKKKKMEHIHARALITLAASLKITHFPDQEAGSQTVSHFRKMLDLTHRPSESRSLAVPVTSVEDFILNHC